MDVILKLKRFAYLDDATRGVLFVDGEPFQTIEKPWVENPKGKGGLPFASCIPDGMYNVRPFKRPSGDEVYILSNPDNGVWEFDEDRPDKEVGRYLILIHPGNTADDVVGCIAPGRAGADRFVSSSRAAMNRIRKLLRTDEHILEISPKGTS
jgi:hypothetical protein